MKLTLDILEGYVFKPFEAIFRVSSKFVTYTFGVAFTTSLAGFAIAIYIALFLFSTLDLKSSGTDEAFLRLFTLLCAFIYAPGYYLHFGMLSRLGVPCFTKSLNTINKYIIKNKLVPPPDSETTRLRDLLKALEDLPKSNMIAALIYPSIVMVSVVLQEFIIGTKFNAGIMMLGISSAIFIYVFTTFITAELLTGSMRRNVKKYLEDKNLLFEERTTFSIKRKFIFINALVLLAMIELGLMFYFSSSKIVAIIPIIFIIMTAVIVGSLLFFYMQSIQHSLLDIESAALDLASGGKGKLFMRGLDKEIVTTGKGFISAALEVNEIRANLERKVDERTSELNEALKKLEEKDKIIQLELNVASRIQKGILPSASFSQNGLQMSAYHQSMEEIGGDFYDIIPLRNNCLGFLIADVSGHGIPAALVTTMAKICFIQGSQNCLSPKRIFKRVNESIVNIIKTQEYLTAFFIIISPSYDILYANASHRPVYVIRKKTSTIDAWDTNGLFIGAMDNSQVGDSYEEKPDKIEPGDRIFLYTDGLVEARNKHSEEFGETRLMNLLIDTKDMSIEDAKKNIIEIWKKFLGDTKVNDDVTFLIVELPLVSDEALHFRYEAEKLINTEQYEQAIPKLVKALEINSQDFVSHELIGLCYFKTGDFLNAIEHLKNYTIQNPNDQYALYLLSASLYNSQDYSRALLNARAAAQLNPNDVKTLTVMAKSLQKLNRHEESADIWKQIIEIDPGNISAKKEIFLDS